MATSVPDLLRDVESRVDELRGMADAALADLQDEVRNIDHENFDLPRGTQFSLYGNPADEISIDEVSAPTDLSGLKDLPTDGVDSIKAIADGLTERADGLDPSNYGDIGEMEDVTFDSQVDISDYQKFIKCLWESDFFQDLKGWVNNIMQTGGPNITTEVQDALFDAQSERDLKATNEALDLIRGDFAKTGFPLPTDMLQAKEREIIAKHEDVRLDRSREIITLMAERAHDAIKHAVDSGLRKEDICTGFNIGLGRIFTSIADNLLDEFKAQLSAAISKYETNLKAEALRVDIAMKNQDIIMNNIQTDIARADIYSKEIDAQIRQLGYSIEKEKAYVDAKLKEYELRHKPNEYKIAKGELDLRYKDLLLNEYNITAANELKRQTAELDGLVEKSKMTLGGYEKALSYMGQVSSAAESQINAILTMVEESDD